MIKKGFFFILIIIATYACNWSDYEGYSKTISGLHYQLNYIGDGGNSPVDDDFIQYNLIVKTLSDSILSYGDLISSAAIVLVGAHLIYLVLKNEIIINKHEHKEKSHIHIHYKGRHFHDKKTLLSTGILMGFGGFRGMLVTLSLVANGKVGVDMIVAFVLGVSVVFGVFGYFVYLLNERFANSLKGIRIVIISIALLSISIGLTTFVKVLNNV